MARNRGISIGERGDLTSETLARPVERGGVYFDPANAGPSKNTRQERDTEEAVSAVRTPSVAAQQSRVAPSTAPRQTNAAVQSRTATASATPAAPSALANTAGERGRAALSGISSTAKAGAGAAVGGARKGKVAVAGR